MPAPLKTDVAIIGAGVIGLATALRLAASGREIVVVDPNEAGSGASYGHAGAIAPYGCAPIGNPDVLRNLPHLLFDPESPLAIRPAAPVADALRLAINAGQCRPIVPRPGTVPRAISLAKARDDGTNHLWHPAAGLEIQAAGLVQYFPSIKTKL
jgi:glycine/D-amino acid oxidase-like deaminating enzyme